MWDSLLLPTVILPILLRRRAPFAAAALLAAGCVVSGAPTFDQFRLAAAVPAGMLILYSLATRADRPRAVAGLALVLAGMVFIGFTDIVLKDNGGPVGMVFFSFPLCIGVWAAGRVVRSREQVAEQLAEKSQLLERQREETAALAVEVERTRLASDLDAAARSRVRELIELAATAERSDRTDPERMRETFGHIERIGRDSLNELRGLLGVLRSDERGTARRLGPRWPSSTPCSPRPGPADAWSTSRWRGSVARCRAAWSWRSTARCSTRWWPSAATRTSRPPCSSATSPPRSTSRCADSRSRAAGRPPRSPPLASG